MHYSDGWSSLGRAAWEADYYTAHSGLGGAFDWFKDQVVKTAETAADAGRQLIGSSITGSGGASSGSLRPAAPAPAPVQSGGFLSGDIGKYAIYAGVAVVGVLVIKKFIGGRRKNPSRRRRRR